MDNNHEGSIKTIGKYSYYMLKCLGQGSFGKVFEGYENTTRQKVAIKKVDFKTIEKDSYLEKAIHEQIRILNKFKHPNIVQLHEVLNSKRSLYIIMDFCRDGDLKKYLRNKKKVNEEEAFEIMKQVLKGYQELARNNTIHRDLKPANILINGGLFKICDFGFSKVIKDPNTALKTCVGSPIYMAPQILEKKDYSAKCDIWSLGIIYYQLLHGSVPWSARSEAELLQNIKNIPIRFNPSLHLTPETEKTIKWMLQVREEQRASLKDLQRIFQIQTESIHPEIIESKQIFQQKSLSVSSPQLNNMLSRHFFQELSFRYFVCVQLKSRLSPLNRYNFTKNNFERLIVLIISSIICSYERRKADIERIHEQDVVEMVSRQHEMYQEFREQFYEELNKDYATCQILKEFQFTDIAHNNFTEEVMKKGDKLILKITDSLLKQINQELKVVTEKVERSLFLYVAEIIMDMILLNEKKAKTGLSDVGGYMKDRAVNVIEKRVQIKLSQFQRISVSQFY